jgi:hypothetical protein
MVLAAVGAREYGGLSFRGRKAGDEWRGCGGGFAGLKELFWGARVGVAMKTLMFMKLDRLRCGGRKSVVVGGALLSLITSGTVAKEERVAGPLPYADEPAVIQAIGGLADRTALALPKFKVDAKSDIYGCQTNGPVTRGYTMRMAYAPERQTALYHGGDHQTIRSNDVWEYHLGSNTWHMIFEPDGGNHGPMKDVLLFLARRLRANPDDAMTAEERKRFEEVRPWWKANVILKDGYFTTTHGGPILPVHTWDTLVYEPNREFRWRRSTGRLTSPTAVSGCLILTRSSGSFTNVRRLVRCPIWRGWEQRCAIFRS